MRELVSSRRSIWIALLVATFVVLAPHSAEAGRKVVIMRTGGTVDAFVRKQLEYQLLELARRVDPKATQVDFSFTDAAAVSNCVGELEKCRGAVLDEFGVDELLVATADPGADGTVTITVQRAAKGKPIQTVTFAVRKEALNAEVGARVGPWYGAPKGAPAASVGATPVPPSSSTSPPPATETKPPPTETDVGESAPESLPPAPGEAPAAVAPSTANHDDGSFGVGRPYLAGVIGGGVLSAVGVVLWTRASSVQTDIDRAKTATAADIRGLQDLESTGRTYALVGNIAVISGVALAATCGYFYWRARRHNSSSVAIVPTVQAHGVGLTLTIGGLP